MPPSGLRNQRNSLPPPSGRTGRLQCRCPLFQGAFGGTKYSTKKLNEERTQLAGEVAEYKERLSAVLEDVKILRDVRHWLNQVLPSEQYRQTAEPGKKPSIQQAVKGRGAAYPGGTGRETPAAPHREKTGYGTLTGACHFLFENDRRFSYFQEDLVECI